AIAQVERVRPVIEVRDVVDEKVGPSVIEGSRSFDDMNQFMNFDALDQGELFVSQPIEMFECGAVIDEPAQNAGAEQPAADRIVAGIDPAKIDCERWLEVLTGHLSRDDSKIGVQTL